MAAHGTMTFVPPQEAEEWRPYTATLSAAPYRCRIGDQLAISGSGYPAGATVEIVWHSVEGYYELEGRTEFTGPRYRPAEAVLATVVADDSGDIRASVAVPVDFGGPHDIRGRVAGHEESQCGVTVLPSWEISPTSGPLGTTVELKITGIDIRDSMNTWHILWDNRYLGLVTGVTTHGVGIARFRAAGPAGVHHIAAWNNSFQSTPYLAWETSPFRDEFESPAEFTFTVTADEGVAPVQLDDFAATDTPWPIDEQLPGKLSLSKQRCNVGEPVRLTGSGLPAGESLDLQWRTVTGDRVTHGGIVHHSQLLGRVTTDAAGTFTFDLATPDDLGGNHRIDVCRGNEVLAATGMMVGASVVSCTPEVRAGEKIAVHLKGLGWTTYDNTYTVTYDNSFIGYVCGFSTHGDVKFRITATGAPGTHLLDLYPTIYKGKDEMPKVYSMPQLSYAVDHPQRKTPAIRLAVTVVE